MQVSTVHYTPAAPLGGALAGQAKKDGLPVIAQEAPQNPQPANAGSAAPLASASVSLSAATQAADVPPMPAVPVYAEIWRADIKVAQVDVHGQVTIFDGSRAAEGGSLAGPLLAAQRAVQLARQLGGEIRSAGQALDGQTLLMRARLANAYAA